MTEPLADDPTMGVNYGPQPNTTTEGHPPREPLADVIARVERNRHRYMTPPQMHRPHDPDREYYDLDRVIEAAKVTLAWDESDSESERKAGRTGYGTREGKS